MNSATYHRGVLLDAAVFVVALGLLVFGPLGSAKAQLLKASGPLPSFEVATIKPSQSAADLYGFRLAEERLMAGDIPLARLIRFAYNVKSDSQIENMPSWAGAEKFDIDAKIADAQFEKMKDLPPDRRFEQYQLMLQSLLADRFKLRISTRMKELPVYALVVVKGGPKLTPAEVSRDPAKQRYGEMAIRSKGEMNASAVSMARLAQALAGCPRRATAW
jgi:bla regulator protein blaR1